MFTVMFLPVDWQLEVKMRWIMTKKSEVSGRLELEKRFSQ